MEKLDNYHYHEMLDRLYIVNSMIDEIIVNHPVYESDEKLKLIVGIAISRLVEAYQYIGSTYNNVNQEK